jgi:hypothetical protein
MPWGQANGILVISILHCHPHHHQHNSNHHNLIINPIIVITMRGLHAILRVTVVATVVVSDVDFLFFLLFFCRVIVAVPRACASLLQPPAHGPAPVTSTCSFPRHSPEQPGVFAGCP